MLHLCSWHAWRLQTHKGLSIECTCNSPEQMSEQMLALILWL